MNARPVKILYNDEAGNSRTKRVNFTGWGFLNYSFHTNPDEK